MPKSTYNIVSSVAGEWSPKLSARVDQQKYHSALRQSLNMIPYKSGGLTRRVGTQYIGSCKLANTTGHNYAVRTMPFIFSPATTFDLEFGHSYIRFYSNGHQVTVSSAATWTTATNYSAGSFVEDPGDSNNIYYSVAGINGGTTQPHLDSAHWTKQAIYEVPSPYSADAGTGSIFTTDVFVVVPCQSNDIIYLVHPDYPPYSLTRFGDTDWVMEEVPFLSPALLDQNGTDIVLTPGAVQGTGVSLTASAPAWVASNYYTLADAVEVSSVIYQCIHSHISSAAFSTDKATKWKAINIFNSQHIGSTWQLATLRSAAFVQWGADAGGAQSTAASGFTQGTSEQIQCLGAYEVHTYGVWSATIQVQRSLDGAITWDTVQTTIGNSDRNVDLKGTAAQAGIYRLVVSNVAVPINPGATAPRVTFECVDAFLYGLVKITGYTSSNVATCDVITQLTDSNPLQTQWVSGTSYVVGNEVSFAFVNYTCSSNVSGSTPPSQDSAHWNATAPGGTEYWSEAAWSDYRGYPQAICSFQQRIWYASSGYEPQRVWGTVQNDIENFALGDQTLATDSVVFDLNAPRRGPIVWLTAQTDLFVGFSGAEWVMNAGQNGTGSASSGAAITPSAIAAFEQGTFGSAPQVQPEVVGNAVLFVQRQADAIRQMLFSVYTAKYMSQDLSLLADHLFTSGVVQIAYQPRWRHQGILWCVTQEGSLCGLTYDLDQEIFGWCRCKTGWGQTDDNGYAIASDNGFESVSVIDGNGTADDEVWVVANRTIGGVKTRFIERINPNNWEETFSGAPNAPAPYLPNAYYVDCGSTITSPGSLTLTGLDYLDGRYVVGLADGINFGPTLVAGGSITLPNSIPTTVTTVQVGLPILYAGQAMRMDSDNRAGNTQGLVKQVSDVFIRVWNSCGGSIGNGSVQYPTWVLGNSYAIGAYVLSAVNGQAYYCFATDSSSATDPSLNPTLWLAVPTPVYRMPVPIPYTGSQSVPFGVPTLITTPTDIRITPMLNANMDTDPQIIVTGNDALPLTILGITTKYELISGA